MFRTQLGLFWIFLLGCCHRSQAKLHLTNRISVALAGNAVIHQLEVTIPANCTMLNIECYHKNYQIWEESLECQPSPSPQCIRLLANITMHNSSCSGEYYFEYKEEKVYWVVLVRDMGYQPDARSSVVPLLVVIIIILLLLSITGSVYIFKRCKNNSSSKEDGDKVKARKQKRNTVVTREEAKSDSVYTALEHGTVSVYDVLNVEEAVGASAESQTSKTKAKPSPVEEGIFESVYENL